MSRPPRGREDGPPTLRSRTSGSPGRSDGHHAVGVPKEPRTVELSWVFGSGQVSIVWIIVFSAILGWLVGIVTGAIIRHRTRDRT